MDKSQLTNDDYEKILQFISVIRNEKVDYRYSVLKCLSQIFTFNRITFFLIDQNESFMSPIGLNISDRLFSLYTEYYFKTDIFRPVNVFSQLMLSRNTFTISDLMPLRQFESTEYYNDFLKEENLYYEIAMPLKSGKKLIGAVGIFRSKEEGNFTARELELLNHISSHISFHLNEYLETTQFFTNNIFIKTVLIKHLWVWSC